MLDSNSFSTMLDYFLEHATIAEWLILHMVFSAIMALIVLWLLPNKYKQGCQKRILFLFYFVISFFVSEFFLFFYFLVLILSFYLPYVKNKISFSELSFPEYSIHTKLHQGFAGLSGAKERLQHKGLPMQTRVDSLMMLQHISKGHVTGILNSLLADEQDDLRLLAFGMIDKREKSINSKINNLLTTLADLKLEYNEDNGTCPKIRITHIRLAELYWSYVYDNLVQGDLRQYCLETAENYLNEVFEQSDNNDGSVFLLYAKIKHARGDYDKALQYFNLAIEAGVAPLRVIPYIAEIYFYQRDFVKVKMVMHQLQDCAVILPNIKHVMHLWLMRHEQLS